MDAGDDFVVLELLEEGGKVLGREPLERPLDDATAVHLHRQLHHVTDEGALVYTSENLGIADLQQLLHDVVAKDVAAQRRKSVTSAGRQQFLHHQILLGRWGDLQPLLDEPTAVLIAAEVDDVSPNVGYRPRARGGLVVPKLFEHGIGRAGVGGR